MLAMGAMVLLGWFWACDILQIMTKQTRILFFGDSITYGAWDTQGGYVERLKAKAHQQTVQSGGEQKIQVVNLGLGGDSSTKILARLEPEIQARQSSSWPLILVFSFGTNDERQSQGKVETPKTQFESNISAMITIAQKVTQTILFIGASPLAKSEVVFKDKNYSNSRIDEYNALTKKISTAANIPFVSLKDAFKNATDQKLFAYDNIHPNDAGHALIASVVEHELQKLLS